MRAPWSRYGVALLAVAAVLGVAGCGGGDEGGDSARAAPGATTSGRTDTATARSQTSPTATAPSAPKPAAPPLRPARCPAGLTGCRAVTGRVVYVEAVDPDGDGDAHFVVTGGSVTAPGFSAIDVRVGLRPDPLPGVGDTVTAAGQVQTGSHSQAQIHAVEVRVRYRR